MRTLVLLVLAGSVAAQSTWTVDDSGGADFSSLVAAVSAPAVVDGDTLLVEPGNYAAFTTGKSLHILGATGAMPPHVGAESRLDGCGFATVAGIDFTELLCQDIPGRLVLEDCDIGHPFAQTYGITDDSFLIQNCAEVVVSNSTLKGKTGDLTYTEAPGVHVQASVVALVNCTITGGNGGEGDWSGFPGQPGVRVENGSVLTVAGCSSVGGDAGPGAFGNCQSWAGEGLLILDSVVRVRGDAGDTIAGGNHCGITGKAFAIAGLDSDVTVSGVTLLAPPFSGGLLGTGSFSQPSPAEPLLWVGGNPEPGSMRRLNVAGPAGSTALVLFSLQPLLASSPKILGEPLWLDPGATLLQLPLALIGQQLPVNVNLPLPSEPAFAGVTAWVQGFVPAGGGKFQATNAASIVLRF